MPTQLTASQVQWQQMQWLFNTKDDALIHWCTKTGNLHRIEDIRRKHRELREIHNGSEDVFETPLTGDR